MKINYPWMMSAIIFVRILVVEGLSLLLFPLTSWAWTVSDKVVELSEETQISVPPLTDTSQRGHISDLMNAPQLALTPTQEEGEERLKTFTLERGEKTLKRPDVNLKERTGPIFEKTESTHTFEDEAMIDYQQALEYLKNKNYPQAEKLLIHTLNQLPTHHLSRAELALLYLKENHLEEAERILTEGLRLDENNPEFLRLMAMLHDRRGEPEKALSLLVKVKDSRRRDKNYIAFLGHLYQQTGQYGLARQQYFLLLQSEPNNPLWLLGVSIALDAEGQRDAALEGYSRLMREGNIGSEVLKYVQNRISLLKG